MASIIESAADQLRGRMNITILQNIAADAAWIIENDVRDSRRSAPFHKLAARSDAQMPEDLRSALERSVTSLRDESPLVAEQIDECLERCRTEMARR